MTGERIKFVVGRFEETLPQLAIEVDKISLLHIDSDLYSSAMSALENLGRRLIYGAIIIFDEFCGFEGAGRYEQRAFDEWLDKVPWEARIIGRSSRGQVAFRLVNP